MTEINKAIEGPENSGEWLCVRCVKQKIKRWEKKDHTRELSWFTKAGYSSPHTSCEIIHYSIQLVETSNQHYKVLITPDQSDYTLYYQPQQASTILCTLAKERLVFSISKLLSPIDFEKYSSLCMVICFGKRKISQKRCYKHKLKLIERQINLVKAWGVCLCLLKSFRENEGFLLWERLKALCVNSCLPSSQPSCIYRDRETWSPLHKTAVIALIQMWFALQNEARWESMKFCTCRTFCRTFSAFSCTWQKFHTLLLSCCELLRVW
jgi:hypothetical protein